MTSFAKKLIVYAKCLIFWLLYFVVARVVFLLFNLPELHGATFGDVLSIFGHGLYIDLSVVGYIGFFVVPIFIAAAFIRSQRFFKIALLVYNALLVVVFSILIVADAEIYRYWGFRLDTSPLHYLKTPEVIGASLSTSRLIGLIMLIIVLVTASLSAFYLWIIRKIKYPANERFYSCFYLLIAGLLIIPIRGGFDTAPMNVGSVFFSETMFHNHAAVNEVWNFGQSLLRDEYDTDRYNYLTNSELQRYYAEAMTSDTVAYDVFTTVPQHVVIVVLESFTAKAMSVYTTDTSITPNLERWRGRSLLFDNFYANGDRSEKGLVAIFGATPILPSCSLMKNPEKTRRLPSLVRRLVEAGYASSYFYGGDVNFANMHSYMRQVGFAEIVSKAEMNFDCRPSEWGYNDEYVFDTFYNHVAARRQPSVDAMFTLSSHEPYDVPHHSFGDNTEWDKAKNAYFYTDSCLNIFLNRLAALPSWDSTLVVLVADHGTRFGNVEEHSPSKFKCLMMWTGGVLNHPGDTCTATCDQVDIAATLLSSMHMRCNDFPFSENVFAKRHPHAFFAYSSGWGFLKDSLTAVFDTDARQFLLASDENAKKQGKACCQTIAEYYEGELGFN